MIIEESIIKTQAVFNQDKTHRILLKKTWNEGQPSTTILMTNPSTANIYTLDFTTMYCINNLSALGYGSVSIVNLFSRMTTKLDLKGDLDELTIAENTEQIIRSASETDIFIVAMGKIAVTHKRVGVYQYNLFEKLRQFQDKIRTIAASDGTENLHPLSPKLRTAWTIIPYLLPSPPKENVGEAQAEAETGTTANADKSKKSAKK